MEDIVRNILEERIPNARLYAIKTHHVYSTRDDAYLHTKYEVSVFSERGKGDCYIGSARGDQDDALWAEAAHNAADKVLEACGNRKELVERYGEDTVAEIEARLK